MTQWAAEQDCSIISLSESALDGRLEEALQKPQRAVQITAVDQDAEEIQEAANGLLEAKKLVSYYTKSLALYK